MSGDFIINRPCEMFYEMARKACCPHCEACFCKFAIVVSKKSASGLCAIKANSAFSIALKQVLVSAYAC